MLDNLDYLNFHRLSFKKFRAHKIKIAGSIIRRCERRNSVKKV